MFRKKAQPDAQKQNQAQTSTVIEQKPMRQRRQKIRAGDIGLGEWRAEVEKLQNHPLTQAKIINGQLLSAIYSILEQISAKIDSLSARLEKIESLQADSRVKHVKVKEAVAEFEAGLSNQERKIFALIKKKKARQAIDIANVLKISRSNASLKLNKLFDMGVLNKERDGKDTFYEIK